jgi:hypothetical protein
VLLDRADELHGKHTLFGRCIGDTIYSRFIYAPLQLAADEIPIDVLKIGGMGQHLFATPASASHFLQNSMRMESLPSMSAMIIEKTSWR